MGLLDEKVCMVTGAHRGIGAEIVKRFAEEGATVYANARITGSLDGFCDEINERTSGKAIPSYFDVADTPAMKKEIMRIKKDEGKWDVLVNNAGIMRDSLIGMIQQQVLEEVFNTNVFAVIEALQFAAGIMRRQKAGSIINMASIVGVHGSAGQLTYAASKGAVISLTKSAAKELAPYHVRVNAVAPGVIDTDMLRAAKQQVIDKYLNDSIGFHELGTTGDVANACVFLASDLSYYISGQVLGVDGAEVI